MHRHGYQGKKLGRERDQRRALVKGLATALVEYESIRTTRPKAKAMVPYTEKLITKARKGDLHSRRQVVSGLTTVTAAHKLVDDIAPKLGSRTSGYLRIVPVGSRVGDNAQMVQVSFVDDLSEQPSSKKVKSVKTPESTAKSKSEKKTVTPTKAEEKK